MDENEEERAKIMKEQFTDDLEQLKHLDNASQAIQSQFLQVKGIFVGFVGVILAIFYKLHHPPKILAPLEVVMFVSFLLLAIDILINALDLKRSILSQVENTSLSSVQLVANNYPEYTKYGKDASDKRFKKMTAKVLDAMKSEKSIDEIGKLLFRYNYSFIWWFDISPYLWAMLIIAVPLLFVLNG